MRQWCEYFRYLCLFLSVFVGELLRRWHEDNACEDAEHKAAEVCKVANSRQNSERARDEDGDDDVNEVFHGRDDCLPVPLQIDKEKPIQSKECSRSATCDLFGYKNGRCNVTSNSCD